MSNISLSIIVSCLEEATQPHHFNYVVKRYKKYLLESEKLFNIFKDRAIVAIQNHTHPKDASELQLMIDELGLERKARTNFLVSVGKPIVDIFAQKLSQEEKQKIERKAIKEAKIERKAVKELVIKSEEISESIMPINSDISDRLRKVEEKLDLLINRVQ